MPLIGLVDPSHDERKADEPGRYPNWYPLDELLAIAATQGPKWSPWPYEMIKAAIDAWQERDYISTTMLTGGCYRGTVVERREDFILTLDSLYAPLRGTQAHETLEDAVRPGAVAEARFFTTFEVGVAGQTVEVSCSPDILTADGQLGDWKVTENPPAFYPWRSHTKQVQFNRYIVNHASKWTYDDKPFDIPFDPRRLNIEHLFLTYLGPKGPTVMEVESMQDTVTPLGKPIRRKMPNVWSDEEVEALMLPLLRSMVRALTVFPRWPEGLEVAPEGFPGGQKDWPWNGPAGWKCPGKPLCNLPHCMAKLYPDGLRWPRRTP